MVSRETSDQDLFGPALQAAQRYAELLATEGIVRGLLGPREADRIWDRHMVNSALVGHWIGEGSSVVDLGSGAGLPGIPLALARPDVSVTLVEPLQRRVIFLQEVLAELAVTNPQVKVEVIRGRAEQVNRTFNVVTARALAPLERLVGWAAPLIAPGGMLVALKGSSAQQEIEQAQAQLAKAGLSASVDVFQGVTVVLAQRISD
ncbi:MAG: 16S rRNA (guanine(527)-N(7))-methyltransferase RsmG [Actinomycetes bacterium]